MGFFLDGDVLYKKCKDQMLLRCVDTDEAKKIIHEIHEGICGTHASGHVMARQIMRTRYYWMTLKSDCITYVRKCHKCQIYADKIHVPPSSLHIMVSPWLFLMWGINVIRPITPKASNGHRLIFMVIDYFTKWVKVASYANVTKSVVARFIKREIICRYGLPKRIISDNGLNLNNDMVIEVASDKVSQFDILPTQDKWRGRSGQQKCKEDYSQGYRDIQRLAQKVIFCIICLSNWGSDIDWGNAILTGL